MNCDGSAPAVSLPPYEPLVCITPASRSLGPLPSAPLFKFGPTPISPPFSPPFKFGPPPISPSLQVWALTTPGGPLARPPQPRTSCDATRIRHDPPPSPPAHHTHTPAGLVLAGGMALHGPGVVAPGVPPGTCSDGPRRVRAAWGLGGRWVAGRAAGIVVAWQWATRETKEGQAWHGIRMPRQRPGC